MVQQQDDEQNKPIELSFPAMSSISCLCFFLTFILPIIIIVMIVRAVDKK